MVLCKPVRGELLIIERKQQFAQTCLLLVLASCLPYSALS